MYCIQCGVKLADTEQKCPLCGTVVFHPQLAQKAERPLYPSGKMPAKGAHSKTLCGAVIVLFVIPLMICFFADFLYNGVLDWFGYVAGALLLAYIVAALPLWFRKPNPVVFVPCGFAATAVYLLYINLVTDGNWFLSFAFPIVGGLGLIISAVVVLLRYLRRGKLYVFGGSFVVIGAFMLLVEYLLGKTFGLSFVGWSIYPLIVLVLLGCLMIFLAINASAREMMERKLFF